MEVIIKGKTGKWIEQFWLANLEQDD